MRETQYGTPNPKEIPCLKNQYSSDSTGKNITAAAISHPEAE
ncbi:MAG: hypothetical protein AB1454_05500 [Candidatus Auribacterota bacterium]